MQKLKSFLVNLRQKCAIKVQEFCYVPWMIEHEDIFGDAVHQLERIYFYFPSHPQENDRRHKVMFPLYLLNMLLMWAAIEYEAFRDASKMDKVGFGIAFFLGMVFIIAKMTCLHWNKKKIQTIMESLRKFYPKTFHEKSQKYFWKMKLLRRISSLIIPISLTLYSSFPCIYYLFYRELVLPMPMTIPHLNLLNPFVYFPLYIWCTLLVLSLIMIDIIFDIMIFTMLSAVSLEWLILEEDFRELCEIDNEVVIKEELRKLIIRHQKLKEMSKSLDEIFSTYYLIYFVTNSIAIAIAIFTVSTMEELSHLGMINGVAAAAMLYPVFWNCFFGQLLMTNSMNLAKGVYACGWEKWENLSLKKTMLIVLMNSQRNASISTVMLKPVSMELFYNILNKSNGYHSSLEDLKAKKRND